jgi:hypothetical protein
MKRRLISGECAICAAKLVGDDTYIMYHNYKYHPEVIKEHFEKFYKTIPRISKILYTKSQIYEMILYMFQEMDREEEKLR